eukprot:scaffold482_cov247-Pinguiococcus_pyrenoidosus.AAC.9
MLLGNGQSWLAFSPKQSDARSDHLVGPRQHHALRILGNRLEGPICPQEVLRVPELVQRGKLEHVAGRGEEKIAGQQGDVRRRFLAPKEPHEVQHVLQPTLVGEIGQRPDEDRVRSEDLKLLTLRSSSTQLLVVDALPSLVRFLTNMLHQLSIFAQLTKPLGTSRGFLQLLNGLPGRLQHGEAALVTWSVLDTQPRLHGGANLEGMLHDAGGIRGAREVWLCEVLVRGIAQSLQLFNDYIAGFQLREVRRRSASLQGFAGIVNKGLLPVEGIQAAPHLREILGEQRRLQGGMGLVAFCDSGPQVLPVVCDGVIFEGQGDGGHELIVSLLASVHQLAFCGKGILQHIQVNVDGFPTAHCAVWKGHGAVPLVKQGGQLLPLAVREHRRLLHDCMKRLPDIIRDIRELHHGSPDRRSKLAGASFLHQRRKCRQRWQRGPNRGATSCRPFRMHAVLQKGSEGVLAYALLFPELDKDLARLRLVLSGEVLSVRGLQAVHPLEQTLKVRDVDEFPFTDICKLPKDLSALSDLLVHGDAFLRRRGVDLPLNCQVDGILKLVVDVRH